jgi:MFS superfamily sulfate permease-like transporter
MAAVVTPFLVTVPKEFAELLVLLVLVVGIILLLCGLLRLGFVTAFISHSVMIGFLFGLAIAVSQAPKLFGLHRSHGETIYQLWHLVEQLSGANWVTFAIGAGAVVLLYALEVRAPRASAPRTRLSSATFGDWSHCRLDPLPASFPSNQLPIISND